MMRSIVALVVGGLLSICALPAQAQDAILGQTYGNGVHAYFSGDYVKAHEFLTKAIDAGSHDPRCYYFRGLAYLKLGRPQEAESDFQEGAKLESADLNRTYNVARSLERVQGAARLEVEEHRAAARMAKLEQDEKMRKQRYEELNREERRALESQVGPPPAKGGPEPVVAPQPNGTDNPFANPPAAGSGEKPAEGPEKAKSEPATEEKKPSDEAAKSPEADNPFAQGAEKPAEKSAEKPAGKAPAEPADKAPGKRGSILGGLGNAAKRALGDQDSATPGKPVKKSGADKPAAGKDAAPNPNPFGS